MNGIEKLEQRLAADPASKVFVPLAEEYRKAGHLDRALAVLRAGLHRNPGYASARVALARVHLQRGELVEARALLTLLVAEAPDNLLAVRLLEETGPPAAEPETAAIPETVTPASVPPAAQAAAAIDRQPESTPPPDPAGTSEAVVAPPSWATQRLSRDEVLARLSSAAAHDALADHELPVSPPEPAPAPPQAELSPVEFKLSEPAPPEPVPPEPVPAEPAPPEAAAPEAVALEQAQRDDDWRHGFEALTDGELARPLSVELSSLGENQPEPMSAPAAAPIDEPEAGELDAPGANVSAAPEPTEPEAPEPAPELGAEDEAEPMRLAEPAAPAVVRTLTLARLYRRQGHFDRAARVYRDLLDLDPTNAEAQRELGELCGEGLADITDDDVVPREEAPAAALPRAHAETLAAVRLRKIEYLRTWLDQMRSEG